MTERMAILWLRMIAYAMRGLGDYLREWYGTESSQWYQYVTTASAQERLVDVIPHARQELLKDVNS